MVVVMVVMLMVVMLMVLMLMLLLLMMRRLLMVAVGPSPLALPASGLFLVDSGAAENPPVLLIPGGKRLAAKHQVIVVNNGGHHPWLVGQVGLVGGWVRDVEVGHDHARLWCAVWCRALGRRHVEGVIW